MFMEQFSLLTGMVEIVTVTHKLLISICPVVFSGLQALEEQGLSVESPTMIQLAGDGQQFSLAMNGVPLPFGGSQSFHISLEGAFIWTSSYHQSCESKQLPFDGKNTRKVGTGWSWDL